MSITSRSFLSHAEKTEILIHPSGHVMSGQPQASGLTFQKRNRQEEGRPPYLWPQQSRRLEWKIPQGWPRPPLPGSEYGVFENISHSNIFNISREYFHPCASGGQPLCLCIVIRSHWNLKFISCVCCQNLPVSVTNIYSKANYFWLLVLLCLDLP